MTSSSYITLVINLVALVAMIAGILMHSGRGGGLSDMFGGGGSAALGSSAAERNLNRITSVFALVWIITVVALDFLSGEVGDPRVAWITATVTSKWRNGRRASLRC